MAMMRLLNEFGRESVMLTIEPSRKCSCHCTYCFAMLNSSSQWGSKNYDGSDDGTFESILTKAFGPSYDPTNVAQYSVRNRYPVCFSNTVEPFQDVAQSNAIMKILNNYNIPVWFQSKGLNISGVWDILKNFNDNSSFLLSFPTTEQGIIKRFEPGTPSVAERWATLDRLVDAGFSVTLGLSPYCEDWISDPEPFVGEAVSRGVSSVMFDRLHLNRRQRQNAPDRVMVGLAMPNERQEWNDKLLSHYRAVYQLCLDEEVPLYGCGSIPTLYGMVNTSTSISAEGDYSRGRAWPYHDGAPLMALERAFLDDPDYDPASFDPDATVLVTWDDVVGLMEHDHRIDQPISYSSMRDLIGVKELPVVWRDVLKPASPPREYYRCLWNNPHKSQFMWRHPWSKILLREDGSPWTDAGGNLVMAFHPDRVGPPCEGLPVSDVSGFRQILPA